MLPLPTWQVGRTSVPLRLDLSWRGGTRTVCVLHAAAVLCAGMHRLTQGWLYTAVSLPLRGVHNSTLLLLKAVF